MDKTCKTCTHWEPFFVGKVRMHHMGKCTTLGYYLYTDDYLADRRGPDYKTNENFGCIYYEEEKDSAK